MLPGSLIFGDEPLDVFCLDESALEESPGRVAMRSALASRIRRYHEPERLRERDARMVSK